MSLIVSVFLLLAAAHLLGRVSERLHQPALAGHLIAGVVLGPSVLGWIEPVASLRALSDFAVLIVVLTAGLEMRMQHVAEELRGWNALVLAIGFVLPAALGAGVAVVFALPATATVVVALCVSVTALPVALQILSGMGMLDTPVARLAIAAALLSDVLVFVALGATIDLSSEVAPRSAALPVALALGKLGGLMVAVVAAHALSRRMQERVSRSSAPASGHAVDVAYALLFVLALAAASELIGFHFAIGAFLAALMITPEVLGARSFERLEQTSKAFTAPLFAPLFLAFQGLQFQLQSLSRPALAISMVVAAALAKLFAGYLIGRLRGMRASDAWGVGIVMNARGVMELVTASIAYEEGLIGPEVFSGLVLVGLVTTVLTPLMLRRWQGRTVRAPANDEPARAP